MKNIVFLAFVVFVLGLSSCHNRAKEYKDILREGSWYVYDIESDYKFYSNWMTPALKKYVRSLLDERNMLFLPGDEIVFSKNDVNVRTPWNKGFKYDYHYVGQYIKIGDHTTSFGLKPEGDNDALTLTFDKSSLRMLLNEEENDELLDDMSNLKDFQIVYYLQRPVPLAAQIMSGIYTGELFDGTGQLINQSATLNLFWQDNQLNLSMDEQVVLENGPAFYIEMADLKTKEGFTPGSYEFSGSQMIRQPNYGEVRIELTGRYNAANTVSAEMNIYYGNLVYKLQYQKGVRQWSPELPTERSAGSRMLLKAN